MPRRKQENIKEEKNLKSRTKAKRVVVRRKAAVKVNEAELARIKELLDREERSIEVDLKRDFIDILNERDHIINRQTEAEHKNKKLIIWIGVSLFMLSVVSFWIMSLDVLMRPRYDDSLGKEIEGVSLEEVRDNLSTNLDAVMKEVERLRIESDKIKQDLEKTASSTPEMQDPTNVDLSESNQ